MAETVAKERYLKITGFPKDKKRQLKNIAANLGISMTDWGKMRICEAIEAAPDYLKRDPIS